VPRTETELGTGQYEGLAFGGTGVVRVAGSMYAECGYEREAFAGTGLSFWAFWGCPGVNLMVVPPDTYPYVVVVGVVARVATEEAIAGKPRKADAKFIRWLRRFSGGYWPGSLRGLCFRQLKSDPTVRFRWQLRGGWRHRDWMQWRLAE